jgi:hypothetical protein
MRKLYARALVCAVALLVWQAAVANAVEWKGDYAKALEAAKKAGKPLLVVMEKPGDSMTETVAADSDVTSSSLLEPYELCRIDVTTPEGKCVAEAFDASEFPYTAVTDKEKKNIILRKAGHYSRLDWATMLVTYRNGKKPVAHIESAFLSPSVCFT